MFGRNPRIYLRSTRQFLYLRKRMPKFVKKEIQPAHYFKKIFLSQATNSTQKYATLLSRYSKKCIRYKFIIKLFLKNTISFAKTALAIVKINF